MLAADRSLLEVNLRQSAIKLREKELNLYTENFSAMATQAAVMAGFTTTCLIEISIPEATHPLAKAMLHFAAIVSICANITCVSLSTITTMWGSGKALRGQDGSMDEAVEAINAERELIFRAFAVGLAGNLSTVLSACFIVMESPTSVVASCFVLFTAWTIYSNATRIQRKFFVSAAVRLDDLTRYAPMGSSGTAVTAQRSEASLSSSVDSLPLRESGTGTGTGRNRKNAALEFV